MHLAPILVSVYTRIDHLRNCLNSLKGNPLSTYSDLFVVSDAGRSNEDKIKVDLVREYVEQIVGFKTVNLIKRKENLGSHLSITSAIDSLLRQHKRLIFLEDDNVVSESFLRFMNDSLEFYNDDPSIFSVCGYNYPIDIPRTYQHDVYKWQGYSAWGVGLWYDRWRLVEWTKESIVTFLSDKKKREKLKTYGNMMLFGLKLNLRSPQMTGDTIICKHLVENNLFTIFPVLSYVRNHGHDRTGEHGGFSTIYVNQPINHNTTFTLIKDITVDSTINASLANYFRIPFKTKFLIILSARIPKRIKDILKRTLARRRT